jgi:hypothetical protein
MMNETPPDDAGEDVGEVEVVVAGKKKRVQFEKTSTVNDVVESVIGSAWEEITGLGEEFREIYDNQSENLQNTDLNQTRLATAEAVEGLSEPSVSSSILAELDVTYTVDNGRVYRGRQNQSRACRASNAAAGFRAAAEAIEAWLGEHEELEDLEESDVSSLRARADALEKLENEGIDPSDYEEARNEAEELAGQLNEIADEIEGMEWPGMFG